MRTAPLADRLVEAAVEGVRFYEGRCAWAGFPLRRVVFFATSR